MLTQQVMQKRLPVTVNPVAGPTDINLAGTSTVCGGSSVTLTATSTTVTNPVFTWYSDAALTTGSKCTGASFITPTLNATTTYYVTVKGDNKCENTAATAKSITITVNPAATDADITDQVELLRSVKDQPQLYLPQQLQ